MSDAPLKPCPFCGGTYLYFPHGTDPAVIECSDCGARSGVPNEQTKAAAIAAWNRRADLPPTLADALKVPEVRALVMLIRKCRPSVANMAYGWREDAALVEEIDAALAAFKAMEAGE